MLGNRVLSDLLPGYKPTTMALPLGTLPQPTSLATKGSWSGHSYSFAGVFLAGAEPAPSPFSTKWDPTQIPRIRTNPNWDGSRDFTAGMWLDILERNPGLRYVSDGNPETISFPRGARVGARAGVQGARKTLLTAAAIEPGRPETSAWRCAGVSRCRSAAPSVDRSQPRAWKSASESRSSTSQRSAG